MHHTRLLRHALVVVAFAAIVAASASAASSSHTATVTVTPVRPYHPGDKVWTSTPPTSAMTATPDASGCQRVPGSGYISHDVYAQTTAEYSSSWNWSASSSNESFSWYIKKTDGTIQAHGSSPGGGGSQSVAANNYYWQVQNTGADPQAWNVCYSG